MYREIQNGLLEEGGNPELVIGSFDRILGLGTYQIISEQTRLNINISQISKGEIQNLEKSLQQQDLLLNELKDISKNIGDIKPVIDPATDKPISLQTIVDDSIRYYENQIAILSEDIDTIIELQKILLEVKYLMI